MGILLFVVGIIIMILMRIILLYTKYDYDKDYITCFNDCFVSKKKPVLLDIFMNIMACIVVVFVGGTLVSLFIPFEFSNLKYVVIPFILTLLIYFCLYYFSGLYHFHPIMRVIFFICFIASSIFFKHQLEDYFSKISSDTVIYETTEERELLFFNNIPIQNISGNISGGRFNISGEISTSNEIPYWYINQDGNGVYGSADANNSKIIFIDEDITPYVEIKKHQEVSIYENNNNGERREETISETFYYTFYLPKSIMQ